MTVLQERGIRGWLGKLRSAGLSCCHLRKEEQEWEDVSAINLTVPSAEEEAMLALRRRQVEEAVEKAKLSSREAALIEMVYFDSTFKSPADARWEFGILYNLDSKRVRAIEAKAVRKFRRPAVAIGLRGFEGD